jgi:hypothetical protein
MLISGIVEARKQQRFEIDPIYYTSKGVQPHELPAMSDIVRHLSQCGEPKGHPGWPGEDCSTTMCTTTFLHTGKKWKLVKTEPRHYICTSARQNTSGDV